MIKFKTVVLCLQVTLMLLDKEHKFPYLKEKHTKKVYITLIAERNFTFKFDKSLLQSQSRNPSRTYFVQIKISKKLLIPYITFYASFEKRIISSKSFACH